MNVRRILLTGLGSGLVWGVLFAGFTAGPAVRASWRDEGGPAFDLRQVGAHEVWRRGVAAGVAGALFGAAIAAVLARNEAALAPRDGERRLEWLEEGETLLRHGPANRFRGWLALGGWLFLTDRRLRFVPHRLLQRSAPAEWALGDVVAAEPMNVLHLVPNGLRLRLRDGALERFSVDFGERDAWVASLAPSDAP